MSPTVLNQEHPPPQKKRSKLLKGGGRQVYPSAYLQYKDAVPGKTQPRTFRDLSLKNIEHKNIQNIALIIFLDIPSFQCAIDSTSFYNNGNSEKKDK